MMSLWHQGFKEKKWGLSEYSKHRKWNRNTMEQNVISCLDDVPLVQIQRWACILQFSFTYLIILFIRYANQSAWFIHVYSKSLLVGEAAWANRRYHGHQMLPPEMLKLAKEKYRDWLYIDIYNTIEIIVILGKGMLQTPFSRGKISSRDLAMD